MSAVQFNKDADGIVTLTLNLVSRTMNVLCEELTKPFAEAVQKIEADASVKGVIITSAKKEFLAGADIDGLIQITDAKLAFDMAEAYKGFLRKLEKCGRPVVAALNGTALGGGLELALACHYRVAIDEPKAKFGLPEVKLGLLPGGGGTQRLPRLVGRGKALEMVLTGARIGADEALAIGLVERVVPAAEVLGAARELARTIAAKAPVALRYAKEAVVKGLELPLGDGLRLEGDLSAILRSTEDRLEGARAFLEKRKPEWTGR